jgi:dephospho-CoA kinase
MRTLNEWLDSFDLTDEQSLHEKLIMFNGGKPYGQIVFLAGGAGSGKGFAIKNFMEKNKFKVRDVDEWKSALIKLAQEKGKNPELANLNLRNPKDVFKLHTVVKNLGIKDKTLNMMLNDIKQDRLPNIIFDITLKEIGDINEVLPRLIEVGYDPKNVHLVWVMTNYRVAVQNNAGRDRVVPEDILLKTHEGAAKTMGQILKGKTPSGMDGKVAVILNNPEHTVFFDTNTTQGKKVIKDFMYVTLKKEGKPFEKESAVQKQVFAWMKDNIPKTKETKDLFK